MKINSKFLPVVLGLLASSYGYANHDMLSKDYVRKNIEKLESLINDNQVPSNIDEYLLERFEINIENDEDREYLLAQLYHFEDKLINVEQQLIISGGSSVKFNEVSTLTKNTNKLKESELSASISDEDIMDSMRANIEFGDAQTVDKLMAMIMWVAT